MIHNRCPGPGEHSACSYKYVHILHDSGGGWLKGVKAPTGHALLKNTYSN